MRGVQALGLVAVFWAFVGLVVAWAFGMSLSLSLGGGWYVLTGALIAVPVVALSSFLWLVFREDLA